MLQLADSRICPCAAAELPPMRRPPAHRPITGGVRDANGPCHRDGVRQRRRVLHALDTTTSVSTHEAYTCSLSAPSATEREPLRRPSRPCTNSKTKRTFQAFCFQKVLRSGNHCHVRQPHACRKSDVHAAKVLLLSPLSGWSQCRLPTQHAAHVAVSQAMPLALWAPIFALRYASDLVVRQLQWRQTRRQTAHALACRRCAGDLSQVVDNMAHTRLPEGVVRRLFQQLVVAIEYCHRLGIANRDIKARCRRRRRCSWQIEPRLELSFRQRCRIARRSGAGGRSARSRSPLPLP